MSITRATRSEDGTASGRGVIVLMTVIILGAVLLVVGISAAIVGQTDIIMAGQTDRGQYARSLAVACAEEALFRLKLDSAYAGGTVPIGSGGCAVTVTGSGTSRDITAAATHDGHTRTISVSATRRDNGAGNARAWNISGWREVDP